MTKVPKTMTEMLDQMEEFLVKQGPATETPKGQCSYITSQGKNCGIGMFMTEKELEEVVKRHHNGLPMGSIPRPAALREFDLQFLRDAQYAHDHAAKECTEPDDWPRVIRECIADVRTKWTTRVDNAD